jgi:hypothetical protein
LGDKGGPALIFDNLIVFMCRSSPNLGALTSWILQGLKELYLSPFCIEVLSALVGDRNGVYVYRGLVESPEEKAPLAGPRRRWENNIKMNFQEVGWEGIWTRLIWLRMVTGDGLL